MFKTLFVFLFSCVLAPLFSQTNTGLRSRLLTSYDGLSSDHVKQSVEDHNGTMWFATTKGLNKYDGKNVQRYRTSQIDGQGLPYDDIKSMLLTKSGELWIATQMGLVKKLKNDSFIKINNETLGEEVFPSDNIIKLLQDNRGYIWVATRKGIVILSPDLQNFHTYSTENEPVYSTEKYPNLLPAGDIADLFQDSFGNIWITTWSVGLSLAIPGENFEIDDYQFSTLTNYDLDLPGNLTFKKIIQDENEQIWLQAAYGIFYRLGLDGLNNTTGLDIEKVNIEIFDFDRFDFERNYVSISHYIDDKGLFVCSANRAYLIPPHLLSASPNDNFDEIIEISEISSDIDTKEDIFIDSRNIVWVASNRGVYSYFGSIDQTFEKLPSYESLIENLKIESIFHDHKGTWLGTAEGLFIDDKTKLTEIKYNNKTIKNVSSFEKAINGDIWIGTLHAELYQIQSNVNGYSIIRHSLPWLEAYPSNNQIWNILEYTKGVFWLATQVGAFIYDSNINHLNKWRLPSDGEHDIVFNCFDIAKDADNRIYISATGFGIYIGTLNKDGVHDYVHKGQGDTKSELSSNVVFDLEVVNDNIWIAQNTGVEVYNIKADSFYRIQNLDEAVNGQVLSVVSAHDKIWFTSPAGLAHYSSDDQAVKNYTPIDGLIDDHTMTGHYKDKNGDLYLAGIGGYHLINKDQKFKKDISEELVFTALSIANKPVNEGEVDPILKRSILSKELDQTSEITLSHSHEGVVFNFSIQDFIKPHQYDYSYILKGISDEWINIGQDQKITFTQLPEEDFELGIKAKDQFGSWSTPRFIKINVLTPFWKRPTKLITLGLLTLLAIYVGFKYRTRQVKAQNLLLEETVKKRTLKLVEQNQQLEEIIESNKSLENFAHAASHDLKAPLRSIASFAGLLKIRLEEKLDQKEFSYFTEIEKGATRLNNLVEDILTFSKLESENLNLKNHFVSEIVLEVIDSLNTTIKDSKAEITLKETDTIEELYVDKIKISRVIQNLITNALKFVAEGTNPMIIIYTSENKHKHFIHIQDNGIGISLKHQGEIFEMFKRIEHLSAYDGTGFGLTLSKKIMKMHGGDLQVSSQPGQGSTFTLSFPKKQKRIDDLDLDHFSRSQKRNPINLSNFFS